MSQSLINQGYIPIKEKYHGIRKRFKLVAIPYKSGIYSNKMEKLIGISLIGFESQSLINQGYIPIYMKAATKEKIEIASQSLINQGYIPIKY